MTYMQVTLDNLNGREVAYIPMRKVGFHICQIR